MCFSVTDVAKPLEEASETNSPLLSKMLRGPWKKIVQQAQLPVKHVSRPLEEASETNSPSLLKMLRGPWKKIVQQAQLMKQTHLHSQRCCGAHGKRLHCVQ